MHLAEWATHQCAHGKLLKRAVKGLFWNEKKKIRTKKQQLYHTRHVLLSVICGCTEIGSFMIHVPMCSHMNYALLVTTMNVCIGMNLNRFVFRLSLSLVFTIYHLCDPHTTSKVCFYRLFSLLASLNRQIAKSPNVFESEHIFSFLLFFSSLQFCSCGSLPCYCNICVCLSQIPSMSCETNLAFTPCTVHAHI